MTTRKEFQKWLDQFPEDAKIDVRVPDSDCDESFVMEDVPKTIRQGHEDIVRIFSGKDFDWFSGIGHNGTLVIGKTDSNH